MIETLSIVPVFWPLQPSFCDHILPTDYEYFIQELFCPKLTFSHVIAAIFATLIITQRFKESGVQQIPSLVYYVSVALGKDFPILSEQV
jgi:hypothetical protein